MSDLADGTYDVFVVDATDATLDDGTEVVPLTATGLGRSEIDLMGMPATLTVEGGAPAITIDD